MKNILLSVFIFLVGTTFAQDKRLSFANGYVNSGNFKVTKSVTEGDSYIDVTYKFTGAYMYNQVANGKTYTRIEMPDAKVLNVKGEPALPYYKDMLAVNSLDNISISIVNASYKEYSVSSILPAVGPIIEKKGPIIESSIYKTNAFFPTEEAKVIGSNVYRSVPYTTVALYPVRYNPLSKRIRCYSSVTYRLKYKSVNVSNSLKASKTSMNPLVSVLSNPKALEKFGQASSQLRSADDNDVFDYIIVATKRDLAAVKKFAEWKTLLGYRCTTLVKDKWNNCGEVKTALVSIYNKQKNSIPEYLLIVGDHEDVPAGACSIKHSDRTDNHKECNFHSDNVYACVDSDNIPDVKRGRLSVSSAEESMTVIDKIINYEKNPTTDASFYNKVLALAFHQDQQERNEKGEIIKDYDGTEEFAFVGIAQRIRNYLMNKKSFIVDRFYVENVNKFDGNKKRLWPALDYFGNDLLSDNISWNGVFDYSYNIDAINDGRLFIYHQGHGDEGGMSYVALNKNSISKLKNSNKLPVVFDLACLSGSFADYESTCFAEDFLRKKNGGCVGIFANTHVGWCNWDNNQVENMIHSVFDNKIRNLGDVMNKYLIDLGDNSHYDKHTQYVTHLFGDPSMEMWTDVPTCLTPTITKEGSNIRVKTNGVSGCKVTICRISDMAILSTKTLNGTEDVIYAGNTPCYVTVTKHNYIPYVGVVRDLFLQKMDFNEDRTIHGVNITAGKNVTSELSQGNVTVKGGKTTLLATSSLKLKTGFIVRSGAKFVGKKQARSCNYSGTGSLRSSDIDSDYDELIDFDITDIDTDITDIDDAISEIEGVEIYPNPTNGLLYIHANSPINKIIVSDATGKIVMDINGGSDEIDLNLSSNAKGLYLVNVITESESYIEKVVLK